jgi:hypothetical protein
MAVGVCVLLCIINVLTFVVFIGFLVNATSAESKSNERVGS